MQGKHAVQACSGWDSIWVDRGAHLLGAAQHGRLCLFQLHAHVLADELQRIESQKHETATPRMIKFNVGESSQDSTLDCRAAHRCNQPSIRQSISRLSHEHQDYAMVLAAQPHLSAGECGDVLQVVLTVVAKARRLHRRQLHACRDSIELLTTNDNQRNPAGFTFPLAIRAVLLPVETVISNLTKCTSWLAARRYEFQGTCLRAAC